jgi:hypothetical protein
VSFTPGAAHCSPVSSYTVTASPGDKTATGSGSPITVSGLSNNTSYTFTVTATNPIGASGPSSPSNQITTTGTPSAQITTPTAGVFYAVGQSVSSSFTCSEASGGPGISSCTDQNGHGSGSAVDTSSPGQHTFTVTATSGDGQTGSSSVSYTVAAAPSVSITSPANGSTFTKGQAVTASYSCQEGPRGPGIKSCSGPVASGHPVDTSTAGQHSFSVTAVSLDGQTVTQTVSYTVRLPSNHPVAPPRITQRRDGRFVVVVKVPGPGRVNILVTAWNDNLAHTLRLLNPAPGRFVFARARATANQARTLRIPVYPNANGRRLVKHHRYRVTLRLWVTYTPIGGHPHSTGYYGLHLP